MIRLFIITILIVLVSVPSFSQDSPSDWFNKKKTWYYLFSSAFSPDYTYLTAQVAKDTILLGIEAKILKTTLYTGPQGQFSSLKNDDIIVYHSDRKVYRWADGNFHLLYNFNLNVGDTLEVYIPIDQRVRDFQQQYAYLKVDSTSNFSIGDVTLPSLYLSPILDFGQDLFALRFEGWHIEGVGSLIYFYPLDDLVCDLECPRVLNCIEGLNGDINYNFRDWPCDSYFFTNVSTKEDLELDIVIYPNPSTTDYLTISGLNVTHASIELEVFDINGSVVPFDMSTQSNGTIILKPFNLNQSQILIIHLIHNQKRLVRKIVLLR